MRTGRTPVKTYGSVSWNDKPVIAVSDNGQHVFVSFNGPTGGDPWVAQSHDAGATWTQTKLVDSNRYYFAFDADVASDGTVYFAESSLLYGGGGNKGTTPTGTIDEHVFISRDNGATWIDKVVAPGPAGHRLRRGRLHARLLPRPQRRHGRRGGQARATSTTARPTAGGKQSIYAARSSDKGATWTAPAVISTSGEESTEPDDRGARQRRRPTVWMETTGGGNVDAWNAMEPPLDRRRRDVGAPATRVSDATSGAAYKTAAGFAEVYGDYGEIAITNAGKTIAVWGEGASYTGPGGVWFNREP